MHDAARDWLRRQARALGPVGRAVEIGSRDVNGSARGLFRADAYVGVDVRDGPGVDRIADGASWRPPELVDLVVCAETLEHAVAPLAILVNAGLMLRPGGTLLVTCASDPRAPHSGIDGTANVRPFEHYANVDPDDLARWLEIAGFLTIEREWHRRRGDLYARAVKRHQREEESHAVR